MRERALWRVGPYLRPHLVKIIFIAVSALTSIACQLTIPLIAAAAIDGPIQDGDKAGLVPLFVLVVVLAIIEISLTYRRRRNLAFVATDLETRLRNDLYAHLQRLEIGFHDRWQSGQLLSRASSDISVIRRFSGFGAIFLLVITVEVIGIFILLLFLYPPLAFLTIFTAVPVLLLCRRFERRYHEIVRSIQDQTGDLTTAIEESAKGIRVIKAFGRGNEVFARYDAQCLELRSRELRRVREHTNFVWVLGFIPNLTLGVVLCAGALAVGSGALSIGGLVAFISYVLMLVWPIEALGWILAMAEEAETAAGRVWEVFDTDPLIADKPGARTLVRADGEIRFEGVGFAYPGGERTVLRGVDLEIHPGETLALVGATGAGKTTVATLLSRLQDPTTGSVRLDGHDLRDISLHSLRAAGRIRVRGADAVLGQRAREPAHRPPRRDRCRHRGRARDRAGRHSRTTCPGDSTPASASRDSRSRAVSASGSPWHARSSAAHACSCSTTRCPRSTCTPKRASKKRLRPILAECTALVVVHRPSTVSLADRAALLEDGRIVATGLHRDLLAREPRYAAILSQAAAEAEAKRKWRDRA